MDKDRAAASATGDRETLSMSNDNTAAGRLTDVSNSGPISLVRSGMEVRAASGGEIGHVDDLRMGDAAALTSQGQAWEDGVNPIAQISVAIFGAGSDFPGDVRQHLLRVGYIHVDGKGWLFDRDFYASADQIARVDGDTVYLTVNEDAVFAG
jgi:hypothetical protein